MYGAVIYDEDRIVLPVRLAYNWARRDLPPPDLYGMVYRDAFLTLRCYDILRGEPPDPIDRKTDSDQDAETEVASNRQVAISESRAASLRGMTG